MVYWMGTSRAAGKFNGRDAALGQNPALLYYLRRAGRLLLWRPAGSICTNGTYDFWLQVL